MDFKNGYTDLNTDIRTDIYGLKHGYTDLKNGYTDLNTDLRTDTYGLKHVNFTLNIARNRQQSSKVVKICDSQKRSCRPDNPNVKALVAKGAKAAKIYGRTFTDLNTDIRHRARFFANFRDLFAIFRKFSKVFGGLLRCSDVFGCVRMHSDASGCVRMHSDTFGSFRFFLMNKSIYGLKHGL